MVFYRQLVGPSVPETLRIVAENPSDVDKVIRIVENAANDKGEYISIICINCLTEMCIPLKRKTWYSSCFKPTRSYHPHCSPEYTKFSLSYWEILKESGSETRVRQM